MNGIRKRTAHAIRLTTLPPFPLLRAATVADAEALAELKISLSVEAPHMVFEVADRAALLDRTLAELTATARGERGIFVMEQNGCLLGYIDVHGVLGEGAADFASFNLALRKRWWGLGLGEHLLSAGEEWARLGKFIFVVILVAVRNERALALYQRLDYVICADHRTLSEKKNYVGEHYTMGRQIAPCRTAQSKQSVRPSI